MTLLFIAIAVASTWVGICLLVAGLCVSAARGDRAPSPLAPRLACAGRRRVHALRGLTAARRFTAQR